ncbi:MAG: LCP family protein [Actinomycetota bacterium]
MRFRNYLKYLIILVVIGVIAAAIALNMLNKQDAKDKQEEEQVIEKEPEEKQPPEEAEEEEAGKDNQELTPNLYTSKSSSFKNYSFICPDGWMVYEEGDGRRLKIEKAKGKECIVIYVEDLESKEIVEDQYLAIAEDMDLEVIEDSIYILGEEVEVKGYKYNSSLDQEEEEIDLLSYVEEDNNIYIIKYMGQGVSLEDANQNYASFVSTFNIGESQEPTAKVKENDSINILILGDDSAHDRAGGRVSGRTDIIILVHINLETYQGTIVTIPRDTWVNIPGHGESKINAAHAIGGTELAVETVEQFSGLDIDNYIITDFDGFAPLIDFLGGVTIEVTEDLADGFSGCYLDKGIHHLDGKQTLALCRNRHRPDGAYAREREAAKVIVALYDQKINFETIIKLPAFVNYLLNYTWTDLGFRDILKLLPVLDRIESRNIEITTIPSWPQMVGKASAVVYDEEATKQLFEEIKDQ